MGQSRAAPRDYGSGMHFMFLILAFLICAVVWGFFHANPRGVNSASLAACNAAILALAVGGLVRDLLLFPLSRRSPS